MKKSNFCLKISLIAAGIFLCSTIAYAAPPYKCVNGAALTVGTTGSDPAVLTFNPSPGVSMGVFSTKNAYAINALNTSITPGDANEYLVRSDKTGYYQKRLVVTTVAANVPSVLASVTPAVASYTYMGGGS